jgi:hypothetical protein
LEISERILGWQGEINEGGFLLAMPNYVLLRLDCIAAGFSSLLS